VQTPRIPAFEETPVLVPSIRLPWRRCITTIRWRITVSGGRGKHVHASRSGRLAIRRPCWRGVGVGSATVVSAVLPSVMMAIVMRTMVAMVVVCGFLYISLLASILAAIVAAILTSTMASHQYDIPCMQDTRNPAQNRQDNVDEEIDAASCAGDDRKRWKEECDHC